MPLLSAPTHPVEWYISVFRWLASLTLDRCLKLVQIATFILGIIGAYYRFFKGRIYKGRLESNVSGTAIWKDNNVYIKVVVSIKNIGSTKLTISQNGTAIRLSYCTPRSALVEASSANWKPIGTFKAFEDDHFIESGETTQDQQMFLIPKLDVDAFQVELNVFAGHNLWRSKAIITPDARTKSAKRHIII